MHFHTNIGLKGCESQCAKKAPTSSMRVVMILTGWILIKAQREATSACAQERSRDKARLEESQTA